MVIENAEPRRESQKQGEEADGIHAFTAGCSYPLRQEEPAMVRYRRYPDCSSHIRDEGDCRPVRFKFIKQTGG